jgi:hypothetical protein
MEHCQMSLEHSPARRGDRGGRDGDRGSDRDGDRGSGDGDRDVYTFDEFCIAHRISRSKLYQLLREGRGPRVMHLDSRIRISREAAADWRRQQERAAETERVRKARAQKRADMRERRAAGLTAKAAAETAQPLHD